MNYKKDDIVFWSYSEAKLLSLKGYSPYHCRSQIAIFNGEKFVDTFWHGGENFSFGPEKIGSDIVIEYVGNFADLDKQNSRLECLRRYYDSKDIVNLNHSNNTSGNLYLRKGAERCLETMKKFLSGKIQSRERELEYSKQSLESDKKSLQNLTQETIDSIFF